MSLQGTNYTVKGLRGIRTRKRKTLQTVIAGEANAASGDDDKPSPTATLTVEERITLICDLSEEIRVLDRAILGHAELPEADLETEFDLIEEFAIPVRIELARLRTASQPPPPRLNASAMFHTATMGTPVPRRVTFGHPEFFATSTPVENQPQDHANGFPQHVVRYPKELDIAPEKFSGERLKFQQFKTQFELWVGRQPQSTPRERLMVLKKYVTDDPKALIEPLELTDANYSVAWSLLESNFARIDTERERILTELMNLPRVASPYDAKALRKLLTTIQRDTQILAAMGLPLSAFAPMVKSSIIAALPEKLRQDFKDHLRLNERLAALSLAPGNAAEERGLTSDDPGARQPTLCDTLSTELDHLISFLKTKVNDLEDSKFLDDALKPSPSTSGEDSRKPPSDSGKVNSSKKNTPLTVAAATSNVQTKVKFQRKPCLFCGTADHNSSKCSAQLSHESRLETLGRLKRCVKCFRTEHAVLTECRGPRSPCSACNSQEHYTSMHKDQPTAPSAAVLALPVAGAVATENTLIMTAMAYIVNGRLRIPVRVFFDGGSALSFILPRVRRTLRNERPIQRAKLTIEGFSSVHTIETERFNIRLSGALGDESTEVLAYEHDFGVNPRNSCPDRIRSSLRCFAENHPLADPTLLEPDPQPSCDLLIGRDQMYKFILRQAPKVVLDNVEAYETRLGWAVAGPISEPKAGPRAVVASIRAVCCSAELSKPARDLEVLWSLDGFVATAEETGRSADEDSAVRQFEEGLSYENNRYTVNFPKKSSIASLSNNMSVASRGLSRKVAQLQRDPARYRTYHEQIMKFAERGFAVEIPVPNTAEADRVDGTYYMPHHEVRSITAAGERWRIVFNCSAKARGMTSLNEHLLAGPNLNPDLVTLLLNFRLHRVAVTADITQAYMMMQVGQADRKFFRFLWQSPDEQRVRCWQMERVTWGATSSGFLLAATLRKHFNDVAGEHRQELASCLYADDFVKSFATESLAREFTDRLRRVLELASMHLAKWKTNSPDISDHLVSSGADSAAFESSPSNLFKVLGIAWSPGPDVLSFDLSGLGSRAAGHGRPTKRLVLSLVASVYDPLGLLTPFTIRGKRMIQGLWSANLQWSDSIAEEANTELEQWISEAEMFSRFQIPRQYSTRRGRPTSYRLHILGDASPIAYAACAYIEYVFAVGESDFRLVMCKSRLAPRATQSLPRLELLAAVLGVRLKTFLVERFAVEFESVSFYTDSMITYYWATSTEPGRWKTFVTNRVTEIQAMSEPGDWYFVPGEENAADLATRGVSASALIASDNWWSGPAWLREPQEKRPTSRPRCDQTSLECVQTEIRAAVAAIEQRQPLIDLERFGTAGRARRVLAYVIRFLQITRRRQVTTMAETIGLAEIMLLRWSQEQHFSRERQAVAAGERVHSTSKLSAFQLFTDTDGLLRARTRLTLGPMYSSDEKNPIIVAGESRLARLLVLEVHRVNAHFGVSTVLSQLRRRFWLTRARQIIRALLRKCVICRKAQGPPAGQREAPLPEERVTLVSPFRTCGVDFAGPFFVRADSGRLKVYVALFACTSTRAVHLELVPSLETVQTHLALRRFLSSHPGCVKFISDNAKSFVKAATDLKRIFNTVNDKEVRELLLERRVEWSFICPRSPWHGGMYERLIGTFKRSLTKTLGASFISFEEFRTIIAELAAVINQRPITPVSNDLESVEALTPAHFLHGGPPQDPLASVLPLDRLGPQGGMNAAELRNKQLQRTSYFKSLSIRWFREYTLMLRSANQTQGSLHRPIAIGDVCLMKEDNLPRIRWNLVRVLDCHPGRDGIVRTYTVRLANHSVTKRAAQLLYPLELVDATVAERDTQEPGDPIETSPAENPVQEET